MTDVWWQPGDRQLRQFAVLWVLFSLGLAVRCCWPDRSIFPAAAAFGLAVLIGVFGWFRPPIIRPLYVSWMIAVYPIGWTVSRITLAVLFYGLFTPLGLLLRILGRDALGLKLDPELETYWVSKETSDDPRRYLQQY